MGKLKELPEARQTVERFFKWRYENGLSVRQAARLIQYDPSSLAAIENRKKPASPIFMQKIGKILTNIRKP